MEILTIISVTILSSIALLLAIWALYKIYDHEEFHNFITQPSVIKYPDWARVMKETSLKDLENRVKKLEEKHQYIDLNEKTVVDLNTFTSFNDIAELASGFDMTVCWSRTCTETNALLEIRKKGYTLTIYKGDVKEPEIYKELAEDIIKFHKAYK